MINIPTAFMNPHFKNHYFLATEKLTKQTWKVKMFLLLSKNKLNYVFWPLHEVVACLEQPNLLRLPRLNPLIPWYLCTPSLPHLMGQMASNPEEGSLFKASACAQAKSIHPSGIRELPFYLQGLMMDNDKTVSSYRISFLRNNVSDVR